MKTCFGILSVLVALFSFTHSAKAEPYAGVLVGYGTESGSGAGINGGLSLGATAGLQLMPTFGVAATFFHDWLHAGNNEIGENEIFGELNFFSLVMLPSGIHVGNVTRNINGTGYSDLGFGAHTGFEFHLVQNVTIGASIYWTYVTTTEDKHSLINIVAPIKFHF